MRMRLVQVAKSPSSKYLEQVQPDVNAKMRAILVDWLVEVSEEYKLCADTLYQAVNYIDRWERGRERFGTWGRHWVGGSCARH